VFRTPGYILCCKQHSPDVFRGAVYEVYREMGCGFLEAVYQECMERELSQQKIPFVAQADLQIEYKVRFKAEMR